MLLTAGAVMLTSQYIYIRWGKNMFDLFRHLLLLLVFLLFFFCCEMISWYLFDKLSKRKSQRCPRKNSEKARSCWWQRSQHLWIPVSPLESWWLGQLVKKRWLLSWPLDSLVCVCEWSQVWATRHWTARLALETYLCILTLTRCRCLSWHFLSLLHRHADIWPVSCARWLLPGDVQPLQSGGQAPSLPSTLR